MEKCKGLFVVIPVKTGIQSTSIEALTGVGIPHGMSNGHPQGHGTPTGLMFQREVRHASSVANAHRYSGFPLTTGGNDKERQRAKCNV